MAPRQQLQTLLKAIPGVKNVYFQPPSDAKIEYPCIIYKRDNARTEFADNSPYKHKTRYQVTVVDRNPDSAIPEKVAALPMCTFNRFFAADNLNHDVYNLFF